MLKNFVLSVLENMNSINGFYIKLLSSHPEVQYMNVHTINISTAAVDLPSIRTTTAVHTSSSKNLVLSKHPERYYL